MYREIPLRNEIDGSLVGVCKTRKRDQALKRRVDSGKDKVIAAEEAFYKLVEAGDISTFVDFDIDPITESDMDGLFDILKSSTYLSEYYNWIYARAPDQLCVLCNKQVATTIDHFAPRSSFYSLAVCYYNLFPICGWCNGNKGTFWNETVRYSYPFHSKFYRDRWLYCDVAFSNGYKITFSAKPPSGWPNKEKEALIRWFDLLKHNRLFRSYSASFLSDQNSVFKKWFASGGQLGVQMALKEIEVKYKSISPNRFEFALSESLRSCAAFCGGGFDSFKLSGR